MDDGFCTPLLNLHSIVLSKEGEDRPANDLRTGALFKVLTEAPSLSKCRIFAVTLQGNPNRLRKL
jgi:hypothetical protein